MNHFSQSKPSFLIESSPTPIYQRITAGYRDALIKNDYPVIYFAPNQFPNASTAFHYLREQLDVVDYILVFDNSEFLFSCLEKVDGYIFEQSTASLIFIHHDNIWSSCACAQKKRRPSYLDAWHRVNSKSLHFCIEYSNYLDLRKLGLTHVFPFFHASQFAPDRAVQNPAYDLAFVGHVLPGFEVGFHYLQQLPYRHHIAANFWTRLTDLSIKLAPFAEAYAAQTGEPMHGADYVSVRSTYQYALSILATSFRGELLKLITPEVAIAIFGGDPSYLSGKPGNQVIAQANITYFAPTATPEASRRVYAQAAINLNITGIHFDDALNNRVVDVGATGGFILTDWRDDLKNLTSVHQEISYRTIEELNQKIIYYLRHPVERQAIAQQLHRDVCQKRTYDQAVAYILSKLAAMTTRNPSEVVYVDLGCGTHKPQGFVGVDVVPGPHVDVVADLNQTFPFPDSSVDMIRAFDAIEHLRDRIHTMNEIWRIGKPGAEVHIRVPSTDGRGAFQDPTHVSFWNLNSFQYYCVEFPAYLELCHSYGFQGAFSLVSLEHEPEAPDQVIQIRAVLQVIKPLPQKIAKSVDAPVFHLRALNLIIFPNWQQPEETLYEEIAAVLRAIAQHPDRAAIMLLVNQSNFPEDAEVSLEEVFSSIVLNLFLSEGTDISSSGIEIQLIPALTEIAAEVLSQQQVYRIPLKSENLSALPQKGNSAFRICPLSQLEHLRAEQPFGETTGLP